MPTTQFSDLDRIDALAAELDPLLEQFAGDDEHIRRAAGIVSAWAAFDERPFDGEHGAVALCRRGLVEGRADDLASLRYRLERMEQTAAALRALINHVADR